MRLKRIARVLVAFMLLTAVTACFFPEKFTIKINLKKDGSYSMEYDGILTFIMARASNAELSKSDIDGLTHDMKKDPAMKSVAYEGQGKFRINYRKEGSLSGPVHLFDKDLKIVSLKPIANYRASLEGMKLTGKDIEELSKMQMKIDGRVELTTDAPVVNHNAKSAPKLFGLMGSYTWEIKSVSDPAPSMTVQLDESALRGKAEKEIAKIKPTIDAFLTSIKQRNYGATLNYIPRYKMEIESLKSNNPQALWDKIIKEHKAEQINHLKSDFSFQRLYSLLLPSVEWKLIEYREDDRDAQCFINISYKENAYALWQGKLVEQGMIMLMFRDGLFSGYQIIEKGMAYKEPSQLMIIGVTSRLDDNGEMRLVLALAGGKANYKVTKFDLPVPSFNYSWDHNLGKGFLTITTNRGVVLPKSNAPLPVKIVIIDAEGKEAECQFAISTRNVTECHVPYPWYEAGIDPKNFISEFSKCGDKVNKVGVSSLPETTGKWITVNVNQRVNGYSLGGDGSLLYNDKKIVDKIKWGFLDNKPVYAKSIVMSPFSPDKKYAIIMACQEIDADSCWSIYIFDATKGTLKETYVAKYGAAQKVAWLPDGRSALLWCPEGEDSCRYKIDLATGESVEVH